MRDDASGDGDGGDGDGGAAMAMAARRGEDLPSSSGVSTTAQSNGRDDAPPSSRRSAGGVEGSERHVALYGALSQNEDDA